MYISSTQGVIFRICIENDSICPGRYEHPPSPSWGIWGMHLLSQVTLAPPDTFLTFQTPNNGGFQEIVLAITMEDWLMCFMRILIRPHYVLHNRSKGPTLK